MASLSRAKWHPPSPSTPRILHLPRRPRRRQPAKNAPMSSVAGNDQSLLQQQPQGKLETLFGQERAFCHANPPVVLLNSGRQRSPAAEEEESEKVGFREEKWRFQAEILRAECKFLRMERQIAIKRLERERVFMESTLKSALQSLISGRRKVGESENVSLVLEEEIEELAKKLADLQRLSKKTIRRDHELLKETRPNGNVDNQATLLRKQLEKMGGFSGDEDSIIDVREVVKASLKKQGTENGLIKEENASNQGGNLFTDVEILGRKMEGLSEGRLLKKMEDEYRSILSRTANTSAANSVCNSQRYEFLDLPFSLKEPLQEKSCAGHCKVIVRRIMEQVRAETEQWSQMQEMLGQVREEMEQLQASRDFWEGRALDSDSKIQFLNATVEEWKQKALSLEIKEKQLGDGVNSGQERLEEVTIKDIPQPQDREKRVLTCRIKGRKEADKSFRKGREILHEGKNKVIHKGCSIHASSNRQSFRDIGNLSPFSRQNSRRRVLTLQTT